MALAAGGVAEVAATGVGAGAGAVAFVALVPLVSLTSTGTYKIWIVLVMLWTT